MTLPTTDVLGIPIQIIITFCRSRQILRHPSRLMFSREFAHSRISRLSLAPW